MTDISSYANGRNSTRDNSPQAGIVSRAATLFKLGDGYMNRSWNSRYFLLRGSTLQYFTSARDPKPREVIDLLHANVAWLGEYLDQPNCILIDPIGHRNLHIGAESSDESKRWFRWLQEAADPQADPLPMSSSHASPASSHHRVVPEPTKAPASSSKVLPLTIPANLPGHFVEAAGLLQKLVNEHESGSVVAGWNLVDVRDGVRVLTPVVLEAASSTSSSHTVLQALVVVFVLLLIWSGQRFLLSLGLVGFGMKGLFFFHRNPRDGSSSAATAVVSVSTRGCANWILDASSYSAWFPNSPAFSNPADVSNDNLCVGKLVLKRHWWTAPDGTICILAVGETSRYCSWCLRASGRVWFVTNLGPALSAMVGLVQITTEIGDHDGSGVPSLRPNSWTRNFNGALTAPPGGLVFARSTSNKWTFKGNGKPLPALASLFVGFPHTNPPDSATAVLTCLVAAMYPSAVGLGSVGWTRFHPKVGESLLAWIGGNVQVFIEVVEASRPSQGIAVSANVTVTGVGWTLKGVIKYQIGLVGNSALVMNLGNSQLVLESAGAEYQVSLGNLKFFEKSVSWQGVVRVQQSGQPGGDPALVRIRDNGRLVGRSAGGHWLEKLWIENQCVWVLDAGKIAEVSLTKRSTDSLRSRSESSPKAAIPRLSSADEEAVSFISQLQQRVGAEFAQKFPKRATNEYLYRFAKARHFHLEDAVRMVQTHMDWLEEHHVDQLMDFQFTELPQVKATFPHGYHGTDKCGRPIYISRLAKTNQEAMFQVTNWDRFIKFWIQSYEELIWVKMPVCKAAGGENPAVPGAPPPSTLSVVQTLSILDIKGIGLSQLSSKVREFISITSKLASDNYPEILGTMYIVNSPTVFPMIWNAVKSMIDPGTRAKIHVVNAKHTREKLLEVIDPDQLPFFLGGTCKCSPKMPNLDDTDFGCLSSDKGPWKPAGSPQSTA